MSFLNGAKVVKSQKRTASKSAAECNDIFFFYNCTAQQCTKDAFFLYKFLIDFVINRNFPAAAAVRRAVCASALEVLIDGYLLYVQMIPQLICILCK